MHTQGRHHLNRRLIQAPHLTFHLDLGLPFIKEQQLAQVGMPMGFDFPVMQAAARRDRLAVQQVRGRPLQRLAVELEHRDRGFAHLLIGSRADAR
ncbi:hypothetical protein D9M71_650010 [compost metagenome]